MSTVYHINPDSGDVNPCSAQIQCKFGKFQPHYETKEEAQSAAEQILSQNHGLFNVHEKKEESDFTIKFPATSPLSKYIDSGDSILYRGEIYKVNDYHYERAVLAYVVDTDKGEITIDDDDWYHNSEIMLEKNDKTKSLIMPDSDNFTKDFPENARFSDYFDEGDYVTYEDTVYQVDKIDYDYDGREVLVVHDEDKNSKDFYARSYAASFLRMDEKAENKTFAIKVDQDIIAYDDWSGELFDVKVLRADKENNVYIGMANDTPVTLNFDAEENHWLIMD